MSTIRFISTLVRPDATEKSGSGILLSLPHSASQELLSRGMAMVEGTINDCSFPAALEPDGKGSHWFKVNETLIGAAGADAGDTVSVAITPLKDWPEPNVPTDLKDALASDPEAYAIWRGITLMARWDWIRWIGATKQSETRTRRALSVASRLKAGT